MNLLVLGLALRFSAFEFVVRNIENFIELWNTIEKHAFKLKIQISRVFPYCTHLYNIQIQRFFRYN